MDKIIDFFKEENINYTVGKVWTTDAFYRETQNTMIQRKQEGCICVDMECSAIGALAQLRNKEISQFFYCADNLDSEYDDKRSLANESKVDMKQKNVDLAIELAMTLIDTK